MLIQDYPEYSITEDGKVFSHLRNKGMGKGKVLDYNYWREFKPQINHKGYAVVQLMSNTPRLKNFLIHRLVATHFIPNPDNLATVNHINENKLDNRVENLEWMSNRDNLQYSKLRTWTIKCPDDSIITVTNLPLFVEENHLEGSLLRRTWRNKHKGWKHKGYQIIDKR